MKGCLKKDHHSLSAPLPLVRIHPNLSLENNIADVIHHKGHFLLVLRLPLDEENGNYEGHHQHSKKANTPGLQVSNEMNPVSSEDAQATNQESCVKNKIMEMGKKSLNLCIEEDMTFKKNDSRFSV